MSEHSAPLRMALRDYRARARFPVLAVCAVVLALLPGLGAFRGDPDAQRYGYIVGTPLLMMWVGLVSGHLKLILARPETRLVPAPVDQSPEASRTPHDLPARAKVVQSRASGPSTRGATMPVAIKHDVAKGQHARLTEIQQFFHRYSGADSVSAC